MAKKPATPAVVEPKISKMDMVRQALNEDASLSGQTGSEFIKAKFGIDLPPNMFSTYKSNIQKKAGTSTPRATRSHAGSGNISLTELKAFREIVDSHGGIKRTAELLFELADFLGSLDGVREVFAEPEPEVEEDSRELDDEV